MTLTVSSYTVRHAGDNAELLPTDDRIATVMVKACLKSSANGGPVSFTWHNWSLLFADDTTVEPVNAWSPRDFPSALYPNDQDKAVPPGECRAGLIPFGIPAGQASDPVKIVYGYGTTTLEWSR